MREARLIADNEENYHWCTSKIYSSFPELTNDERIMLLEEVFLQADVLGIEIITYSSWGRELNLLTYLPLPQSLSDELIIQRITNVYRQDYVDYRVKDLKRYPPDSKMGKLIRGEILSEFYNISAFHRKFKQRFARKYNAKHHRKGIIWHGRFDSRPIENNMEIVSNIAALIDAIPIIEDRCVEPEKCNLTGFGAACGGKRSQQKRFIQLLQKKTWPKAKNIYEKMIMAHVDNPRHRRRPLLYGGIDLSQLRDKVRDKLKISETQPNHDKTFKKYLVELKAFKDRFGHCHVPANWEENRKLGRWLRNQRNGWRSGRLRPEKVCALTELGVVWEMRNTRTHYNDPTHLRKIHLYRWEKRFNELSLFHKKNNRLPKNSDKSYKTLFLWMSAQRKRKREGSLPDEMAKRLDILGFDWK